MLVVLHFFTRQIKKLTFFVYVNVIFYINLVSVDFWNIFVERITYELFIIDVKCGYISLQNHIPSISKLYT
jgi:hypothetical protein